VEPWWPPSDTSSDLWKLPRKIRLQELVSSNSENIFCVSLLKHKNSRKQETGTVALVNRLVPEIHKSATKCNETIGKWCKNKHGA
jgi:hypothetical protein